MEETRNTNPPTHSKNCYNAQTREPKSVHKRSSRARTTLENGFSTKGANVVITADTHRQRHRHTHTHRLI